MRLVALVLVAAISTAAADPAPELGYRTELIGGDAVASAFIVGGGLLVWHNRNCNCEDMSGELVLLGAGMYVMIGPLIHGDRHHGDRAFASGFLRIGMPLAGGLIAAHASTAVEIEAIAGGALGAMAIDWFVFARDADPPSTVSAFAAPIDRGMVAGIRGTL